MRYQVISGGVCYEERVLRRFVAPVGLVIMIIFCFIFFREALRCEVSIIHWLLAFGWLVVVIHYIMLYCRIRVADKLEFSLEQGRILNCWPKSNKIELSLYESFFCTVLTCEFGYGKATTEKAFYLFSKSPIYRNTVKGQGLFILENLNRSNIIIIPKNSETERWLNTNFPINNIPTFPAVAYKQKKTGDGFA